MYCFGDPAKMSDESVRLALRIHDEVCLFTFFAVARSHHQMAF